LINARSLETILRAIGCAADEEPKEKEEMGRRNIGSIGERISFQQFLERVGRVGKYERRDPEQALRHAFDLFDHKRIGFITALDATSVIPQTELMELGFDEETLRSMVDEFDHDGNGGISYSQFKVIMGFGDCGVGR